MKKVSIAVGIFLILFIGALLLAPLFFDFNSQIKPIIVEALEKNLGAKVTLGDMSFSLIRKVGISIDSVKISKDQLTAEISDLVIVMPYSVLRKAPTEWTNRIKMDLKADEININNRQLVLKTIKSQFIKDNDNVKLKDTKFFVFEGRGTSYLDIDLSQGFKAVFDFEVTNGKWPAEKLKDTLAQRIPNIPRAQEIISNARIDNNFESLKGDVLIQDGVTQIKNLEMNVPKSKLNVKGVGTISAKNYLKANGNLIVPLENIPADLRNFDGRAKIPFQVLGNISNPEINWKKLIEFVVHAYSKDEGKKIIKKEVEKLKDKLKKDERLKELIKDIKF